MFLILFIIKLYKILIFLGARTEDASGSDDEGSLINDGASVTHILTNHKPSFYLLTNHR